MTVWPSASLQMSVPRASRLCDFAAETSVILPTATSCPSTMPRHARAGHRFEICDIAMVVKPSFFGLFHDGRRKRVLAVPFERSGELQDFVFGNRPLRQPTETTACTVGFPSVRVPVLSTTMAFTFSSVSSASAFLMSTPFFAPWPVPTMMDIGVARPRAHGQAMIRTETAATTGVSQAAKDKPDDKRDDRDENHGRDKIRRNHIGQTLDRRAAALRFADHFDDLRKQRFAADLFARIKKLSVAVDRAADDFVAGGFFDRDRFAGDHRFVDRRFAFDDLAICRYLFIRLDTKRLPGLNMTQIDDFFACRRRVRPSLFQARAARIP